MNRCALVFNGMSESRYAQQGRIIEILHKDFMVDCRGHEDDLETTVSFQQFAQFQQQEVPIDRTLMNLEIIVMIRTLFIGTAWKTRLVNDDMSDVVQLVPRT